MACARPGTKNSLRSGTDATIGFFGSIKASYKEIYGRHKTD